MSGDRFALTRGGRAGEIAADYAARNLLESWPDALLATMLTARIHLDAVNDENGPLKVVQCVCPDDILPVAEESAFAVNLSRLNRLSCAGSSGFD